MQLRNIGEKNHRFVFKKFMKACRELDRRLEMIDKLDVSVNNEISPKIKVKNENKVHEGLGIIDKFGPPIKKPKLVQEEIVLKHF